MVTGSRMLVVGAALEAGEPGYAWMSYEILGKKGRKTCLGRLGGARLGAGAWQRW
jgi:hypothetical protein